MKEQGIRRICCLLPRSQLSYYHDDLLQAYRDAFGEANVCWVPVQDYYLIYPTTLGEQVLPFLAESDKKKKPVVVHCSGGIGRTGHVLAAWVVFGRGFHREAALRAVKEMGRNPYEAVYCENATMDQLNCLLGQCQDSSIPSGDICG